MTISYFERVGSEIALDKEAFCQCNVIIIEKQRIIAFFCNLSLTEKVKTTSIPRKHIYLAFINQPNYLQSNLCALFTQIAKFPTQPWRYLRTPGCHNLLCPRCVLVFR